MISGCDTVQQRTVLKLWQLDQDNICTGKCKYNKKFELMLTRRAKAYSCSGSVV